MTWVRERISIGGQCTLPVGVHAVRHGQHGAVFARCAVSHRPGAAVARSAVAGRACRATAGCRRTQPIGCPRRRSSTTYCVTCHNQRLKTGGLALDALDVANVGGARRGVGEGGRQAARRADAAGRRAAAGAGGDRRLHRLARGRARSRGRRRSESGPHRAVSSTEPRRIPERRSRPARRSRSTPRTWLPTDEISYGFDNIAGVLKLSPLLTERYLNAAQKVARLALGTPAPPNGDLYPRARPARSGRAPRGHAGRHARRHARRLPRAARRRVRHQGAARPRHRLRHPALHRRAAARDQRRRRARAGLHLPATPGEALNIERQVARAPGAGAARPRAATPTAIRAATRRRWRRRKLDDDWVVRVPIKAGVHEIRATFLMKTNAVSEGFRRPFLKPYIGRGTDRQPRNARRRGAARDRDHGPAQSRRRRRLAELSARLRLPPGEGPPRKTACAKTILSKLARRAYRRPVTDEDIDGAARLLQRGPRRRRLRRRHRAGAAAHPRQPVVPVPHRVRSARGCARRRRLSHQRSRAGLAPVVLPVEQHPRRRAPRPGDAGQAARAGGARAPDAADARRSALAGVHRQLRRAVAVAAPAARTSCPIRFCIPTTATRWRWRFSAKRSSSSTASCARIGRALDLLTAELHVRQRAARAALRHPQREGHQLPARRRCPPTARAAGCSARARILDGDGVAEPHLAGRARQVGAAERCSARRRPSRRPNVPGARRRTARRSPRSARCAQRLEQHRANSGVRVLPQADGPDRVRARELRRGRASTGPTTRTSSRSTTPASTPTARRIDGLAGLRQVLVNHSDQFLVNVTKTLLTYALGRGVEYYDAPAVRAILRDAAPQRLPLLVDRSRHRQERAISDEEIRVMIITKKALSRRTVLRGIGVSLALPLLDAMVPALSAATTPRSRCSATASSTCRTGWR